MEKIPMRPHGGFGEEDVGSYREIAFILDGRNDKYSGIEHLNKLLSEGWTVKMAKPFSITTIGNIQTPSIEHGRMLIVLRNGPSQKDI